MAYQTYRLMSNISIKVFCCPFFFKNTRHSESTSHFPSTHFSHQKSSSNEVAMIIERILNSDCRTKYRAPCQATAPSIGGCLDIMEWVILGQKLELKYNLFFMSCGASRVAQWSKALHHSASYASRDTACTRTRVWGNLATNGVGGFRVKRALRQEAVLLGWVGFRRTRGSRPSALPSPYGSNSKGTRLTVNYIQQNWGEKVVKKT